MLTPKMIDPSETSAVFRAAREQAGSVNLDADMGGLNDAVIKFTKVEKFTTFLAEYAFVDGDIVVHLYPPMEQFETSLVNNAPRVSAEYLRFWKRSFPQVLSPVAEGYFKISQPTLRAAYVEEMTSWWMRAGGFATRLDPDGFILRFFEVLDHALDVVSAANT